MKLPDNPVEWLALAVALAMALIGGVSTIALLRRITNYRWVRAKVVGHEPSVDSEGSTVWRSRFEFDVDDGKQTGTDDVEWPGRVHCIGSQLWVGIPNRPDAPIMIWRPWTFLFCMAFTGAGVFGVAALLW